MAVEEYVTPGSVEEVVGLLDGEETVLFAGGTTLMPRVAAGMLRPRRVVGLRRAGLDYVETRDDGSVAVGAMTRLGGLASCDHSLPAAAANGVGAWTLRTLATVGGNLFAPSPYGDVAVALLALDAHARVFGPDGARALAVAELPDGLREREVMRELTFRPDGGDRTAFVKQGRRKLGSPAVVTVAVSLRVVDGRIDAPRVALGGAGDRPSRATSAEEVLAGAEAAPATVAAAADAAAAAARPPTDSVASGWYRSRMIAVQVRRALQDVIQRDPIEETREKAHGIDGG